MAEAEIKVGDSVTFFDLRPSSRTIGMLDARVVVVHAKGDEPINELDLVVNGTPGFKRIKRTTMDDPKPYHWTTKAG